MLQCGSNCSLERAMDGHIMRCSIISSCQSAATSEIVKHFWARVHRGAELYRVPDLYLYLYHVTLLDTTSSSTSSSVYITQYCLVLYLCLQWPSQTTAILRHHILCSITVNNNLVIRCPMQQQAHPACKIPLRKSQKFFLMHREWPEVTQEK